MARRATFVRVSAAEVIALIEKLPPEEQRLVRDFLEAKSLPKAGDGIRRMDLDKAKRIGDGIFDRHPELFRKLAQ